jgi:glycerophosphoryl diester phosphodiesterase
VRRGARPRGATIPRTNRVRPSASARRLARAGAIACACAAALAAAAAPPAPAAPAVQAHRGGPLETGAARFGENTLGAFLAASQAGWRVEIDVRLSRDGVPVAFHDAGLGRATDCIGLVRRRSVAELKQCRVVAPASTGEAIPTLAEVLVQLAKRGATWTLDLKPDPGRAAKRRLAQRTASALAASGAPPSRMVVSSFDRALLRATARHLRARRLRGVRLMLLRRRDARDRPAAARAVRAARGVGARWVGARWPVSRTYVRRVHAARLRLMVWTSPQNRESHALAAARAGVDAIVTDDPAEASAALERCTRRPKPGCRP